MVDLGNIPRGRYWWLQCLYYEIRLSFSRVEFRRMFQVRVGCGSCLCLCGDKGLSDMFKWVSEWEVGSSYLYGRRLLERGYEYKMVG